MGLSDHDLSLSHLAVFAQTKQLQGVRTDGEPVRGRSLAEPGLVGRLDFNRSATLGADEMMMMSPIIAHSEHLGTIELYRVCLPHLSKHVELAIDCCQSDGRALIFQLTMQFLSCYEIP